MILLLVSIRNTDFRTSYKHVVSAHILSWSCHVVLL